MNKIMAVTKPTVQKTPLSLIEREQLAAQIVAVMQAHFARPEPDDMRAVLRAAEGQLAAMETHIP